MKKKKDKKKEDMPEFAFKEFSPEEDRIYVEAVDSYRASLAAGKKLKEAYAGYTITDDELRNIVQADFLKILIAERHFTKQESLETMASALDVPLDLLKDTMKRMLQEVGITAANQFGQQMRGVHPDEIKTDD
ncbi:MAG: hypothetical protein OEW15_14475 [Nitrospirota bacterium]|nr:hypothetical protein [Nitrospirota bacterium]